MRIRPESAAFTVLLGAMAAVPSLSIDTGLPALSIIGAQLHASPAQTALTLSLFFVGFSLAQLMFGPLADRFGRKPTLLSGYAVFTIATFVCAFSPSIATLLAARLVTGAGAAAGAVLVLAIVRDSFEGSAARTRFSYVGMIGALAPMIAPSLGAIVLSFANWRVIYMVMGIGGLLVSLFSGFGLSETLKVKNMDALRPWRLIENYGRVVRHPISFGYILVRALNFGCLFGYVTGSSFVFMSQLGISATVYGWLFAANASGLILGGFTSGRLSARGIGETPPIVVGLCGTLFAAVTLTIIALSGLSSVATLMPLLILNAICAGLITPNATHAALEPMPDIAGVAGAVLGCTTILTGAASSAVFGLLTAFPPAIAMTLVMLAFASASAAVYVFWVRKVKKTYKSVAATAGR